MATNKKRKIPTVNVLARAKAARRAVASNQEAAGVAVKVAKPAAAIRDQIRGARLAAKVEPKDVNSSRASSTKCFSEIVVAAILFRSAFPSLTRTCRALNRCAHS